jgi:hypothetical protein
MIRRNPPFVTSVIVVAVFLVAASAWALTLDVRFKLPPRFNTIKPTAVVDEAGNVLFNGIPGKVEVTNLPTGGSGSCSAEDPISVFKESDGTSPVTLYTVPAGKKLVITDVLGTINGGIPFSFWANDTTDPNRRTTGLSNGEHHFETGIVFQSGETVLTQLSGQVFVSGRLVSSS